ncbi:MAG: hypothetical protein IPJ34_33910 [Myxococcales bacterium]|nr:hypothetical protein [Myxococcales bacterium]
MRFLLLCCAIVPACGGRVEADAPDADSASVDTGCDFCLDTAPPAEPTYIRVQPAEPTAIVDPASGKPAVIDFEVREDPGNVLVSSSSLFTLDDPIVGSFSGSRFTSTLVRADEARWSTLHVRHGASPERRSALVVVGFEGATDPDPTRHGMLVLGTGCGLPKLPLGDKLVFVAPSDGDFDLTLEGGPLTKPIVPDLVAAPPHALPVDPACPTPVVTKAAGPSGLQNIFVGAKKAQRLCAQLPIQDFKGPDVVVRFRVAIRSAGGLSDVREVVYVVRERTCLGGR